MLIWALTTLALLAVGAVALRVQVRASLGNEVKGELGRFATLENNVTSAFAELKRTVRAEPCSTPFISELRRVAFKPDGLNEFMYAPGRIVTCSTSLNPMQGGSSLGSPNLVLAGEEGIALWVNKHLDDIGLPGMSGTVAYQEPFALVIPPQPSWEEKTSWARKEFVISGADGRTWHLGGEAGLFKAISKNGEGQGGLLDLHVASCGPSHVYCVAVKTDMADITHRWRAEIMLAVAFIGFYALWPSSMIYRSLERYWSLEQRFRRNLNTGSIVCAYQPILNLESGNIVGCEVLARWRDVDGSIVPPDQFIDIIARSGDTLAFTQMVVDRAFEELSSRLPEDMHIQVNFNIFPRDLDSGRLMELVSAFSANRDRFQVALEIVESDQVCIEHAQREIERLAAHGIRTYIDDFGSGYSSIHRVASLAIHGVKLDRSFAMAPNESLMARMLVHALEMLGSSGREIVVEGVETQERVDLLAETASGVHVQGYLISKPLSIDALARFLSEWDASRARPADQRAVA